MRAIALHPNGEQLVSASWDNTLNLWDLLTGERVHTLEGHTNRVVTVAFDGETITSGSTDNTIKLWDARTGELRQTLTDHSDWVLTLGLNASGKTLVSGSKDQTIKIWGIADLLDDVSSNRPFNSNGSRSGHSLNQQSRNLMGTMG